TNPSQDKLNVKPLLPFLHRHPDPGPEFPAQSGTGISYDSVWRDCVGDFLWRMDEALLGADHPKLSPSKSPGGRFGWNWSELERPAYADFLPESPGRPICARHQFGRWIGCGDLDLGGFRLWLCAERN